MICYLNSQKILQVIAVYRFFIVQMCIAAFKGSMIDTDPEATIQYGFSDTLYLCSKIKLFIRYIAAH